MSEDKDHGRPPPAGWIPSMEFIHVIFRQQGQVNTSAWYSCSRRSC